MASEVAKLVTEKTWPPEFVPWDPCEVEGGGGGDGHGTCL